MSDTSSAANVGTVRRGAPSPLIFNPDAVLPVNSASAPPPQSRAHTVNMPHVKKNITRRLKLAKQECDAALQKITNNITQFIEEQIRAKQVEVHHTQVLRESLDFHTTDIASAVADLRCPVDDTASDDAGYDAEPEGRHSRHVSVSSSPASFRKPTSLPPVAAPTSSHSSSDTSPRKTPNLATANADKIRPPLDHYPHKEDQKALTVREEYRSRFSPAKPSALSGRQSRDEQQKDISSSLDVPGSRDIAVVLQTEASKVESTEALREKADFARYTTIVLELAADGDHVVTVNQAWRTIVGADPDDLISTGLTESLHPDSKGVFKAAAEELQADEGNTKEIRFKLLVEPESDGQRHAQLR
ncbi:hypothetical protein M422DRAFT_50438 [Sphaerobolus stellatus SS14]|uniref:PAS domain-containing protein n=1 Tax=Sphaerobolus stellatus (strain SS14) TaxID=990650 RepID=A0A0C9V759_SPHS4|nr:hypothetical protein M422DRAFT_50438 [Sphaerobolus stellatus SS14]